MSKLKRPLGLVRYASLNGIEKNQPLRITPRIKGYCVILTALTIAFFSLLITRSDIETSLLRAPGTLFQTPTDGRISNLYLLKLMNKTSRDIPVELKLENYEGKIQVIGGNPLVKAGSLAESSVLIELSINQLNSFKNRLEIGVYSGKEKLEAVDTIFLGPGR
jgi:hypothetical protein